MCVMADFDRVFEFGPVFRAENHRTHRHLSEFTGIDYEMAINEHYNELMDFSEQLFYFLFKNIESRHSNEYIFVFTLIVINILFAKKKKTLSNL